MPLAPGGRAGGRTPAVLTLLLLLAALLPSAGAGDSPRPPPAPVEILSGGLAIEEALRTTSPTSGPGYGPVTSGVATPQQVNHLYHRGSKQFYLELAKPLALTDEQTRRLRHLWEFDQGEKLRYRDALKRSEQELWHLTGADEPSLPDIETVIRRVEGLNAERRLTFIRRVVYAASILTSHQREMLRGHR